MNNVVSVNPNVLGSTPVFSGTHVPIESLFDYLKRGRNVNFFLEQIPTVQRAQIESLLEGLKIKTLSRTVPA
jgi:uncharacterized protein (DUF433 family)